MAQVSWGLNDETVSPSGQTAQSSSPTWGMNDSPVNQPSQTRKPLHLEFGEAPPDDPNYFTNQENDVRNERFSNDMRSIFNVPSISRFKDLDVAQRDSTNVAGNVAGGLYNSPRNILELAAAGVDYAAGTNLAEGVNKVIPRYEPDPNEFGAGFTTGATELASGAIGGRSLVKGAIVAKDAVQAAPGLLSKVGRGATNVAAEGAGAAATASTDTGGMLVGNDSLTGLSFDSATNTYSEDILAKRANIFADTVATTLPIIGVAKGAGVAYNWAGDITWRRLGRYLSNEGTTDKVAGALADSLAGVDSSMNEAQIVQAQQKLKTLLEDPKNKNFRDAMEAPLTPEELSQLTPEEQASYQTLKRDTASTIEAGLKGSTDEAAKSQIIAAKNTREGIIRKNKEGSEDIIARLEAPVAATEGAITGRIEAGGGKEGATSALRTVQKTGTDVVDDARFQRDFQTEQILNAENDLAKQISEDPVLASRVNDLGKEANINIYSGRNQTSDEIAAAMKQAKANMDAELGARVQAVPDDVRIDESAFGDQVQAIVDNPEVNTLLKPAELSTLMDPDANFKQLFALTPKITAAIDAAGRKGNIVLKDNLLALRDTINNPAGGSPEVQAFRDYYKNSWAKYFRDGKLEDFSNLSRDTRAGTVRPVDYSTGTESVINQSITDRTTTKHLYDYLQTPEGGQQGELVSNMLIQDAMAPAASGLNSGKTVEEVLPQVINRLEQVGAQLEKINPQLKSQVDGVITRFRDSNMNLKQMKEEFKVLETAEKNATRAIYADKLRPYFKNSVDPVTGKNTFAPKDNAFDAFSKVFKNSDNNQAVKAAVDAVNASSDPMAKEGLRAAYNNALLDTAFQSGEGIGGGRKLKAGFLDTQKSGKNSILDYGDQIYADQPGYMRFVRGMLSEADTIQKSRSSTSNTPIDSRIIDLEAKDAIDTAVTFIFGPLSRKGSVVRRLGTRVIGADERQQFVSELLTKSMADPDEFLKVFTPLLDKKKAALENPVIKAQIVAWAAKAGLSQVDWDDERDETANWLKNSMSRSETPWVAPSVDQQTEEAIQ